MKSIAVLCFAAALLVPGLQDPKPTAPSPRAPAIANPQIDYPGFLEIARKAENVRATRRLGEPEFAAAMREAGTVLLDARSADEYRLRHVAGAVSEVLLQPARDEGKRAGSPEPARGDASPSCYRAAAITCCRACP